MLDIDIFPNGIRLKEFIGKTKAIAGLGSTPNTELLRWGNMRLLKYVAPETRTVVAPVFIIPSLINRHYVLDLLPEKSLIEYYVSQGAQVYLIDWGSPSDTDRFLDFDSLIEKRLMGFIEEICDQENAPNVHLIGHCLGGTLSSIIASVHPDLVASLTLLTAPIHFEKNGKLATWASYPRFDVGAFVSAYGHAPWPLLQGSFHFLKPFLWLRKGQKLATKFQDREFVRNFMAMEIWSSDSISFIGPCYQTLINELYRQDSLALGRLTLAGKTVNLSKIKCPTLSVIAEDDHIVPPSAGIQVEDMSDLNLKTMLLKGGHIGALLGGRAQRSVWPQLASWLNKSEAKAE